MLGIQAAGWADRSVSTYSRLLTSALLSHESEHQFILYGHDEFPRDAIPAGTRATLVLTNHGWPPDETSPTGRLEWLSQANPDRLDWLVIFDPLGPAFA